MQLFLKIFLLYTSITLTFYIPSEIIFRYTNNGASLGIENACVIVVDEGRGVMYAAIDRGTLYKPSSL